MRGATVHYHGHRPTGTIKVSVVRGQHLSPPNGLGLPGSLVATVTWDSTKYLDEKSKKKLIEYDPTSKAPYHVGETESSSVTFNPEWSIMHESDQLQRLKQLLPSTNFLSRTNSDDTVMSNVTHNRGGSDNVLEVPILQPISALRQILDVKSESAGEDENFDEIELMPWEADLQKGAIVIQVRFSDVLSKLPLFDQILGEVVIPFHNIANGGVDGWFQVLPKGTLETIEDDSIEDTEPADKQSFLTRLTDPDSDSELQRDDEVQIEVPRIYIKADFVPPNTAVTDIDRETSVVVAEHMIWSANATKDSRGFIGSSLETFNTVRGVTGQVQYIQNVLGTILDIIEIIRNAFNFTVRIIFDIANYETFFQFF